MDNKGKINALFLIVIIILFLGLTLFSVFLLKQETDRRVAVENNLALVTKVKQELETQLLDTKKQLALFQDRLKESESKIKSLINDLDVTKSQQEGITQENASLKDALSKEQTDKTNLTTQFTQAQTELNTLKEKITKLEKDKADLEKKAAQAPAKEEVALGKIVVSPTSPANAPPGSILTINKEYQFVVTNLGQPDGVAAGQTLTVTRDKKNLGELKIQRIQGNLSVSDAVPPLKVETLKEGDRVAIKK